MYHYLKTYLNRRVADRNTLLGCAAYQFENRDSLARFDRAMRSRGALGEFCAINKQAVSLGFLAFILLCAIGLSGSAAKQHPARDNKAQLIRDKGQPHKVQHNRGPQASRKNRRRQNRRCDERVDPAYFQTVERLKQTPAIPRPRRRYGFRDLTFFSPYTGERVRVFPYRKNGTLRGRALKRIKRVFRDKKNGAEHPVHPRLVKLLYKLADHFDAKQITIISAYRARNDFSPKTLVSTGKTTEHSRRKNNLPSKNDGKDLTTVDWGAGDDRLHRKGRAVDFFLPGVPLEELVKQARTLGHVGVGYYPAGHYIHLDIRNRASVFWTDRAAPGKRRCYRRVLRRRARLSDRSWKRRQDNPVRNSHKARKAGKPDKAGKAQHKPHKRKNLR